MPAPGGIRGGRYSAWIRAKQRSRSVVLKALSVGCVIVGTAVFGLAPATPNAVAAQPEPINDISYYVTTTSQSVLYQHGYDRGVYDAQHGAADSLVYLDFGGQNQANQTTVNPLNKNGPTYSYSTIESLAEFFAWGYFVGTGTDVTSVLTLAVGTCNCGSWVAQNLGVSWGQIVQVVSNWTVAAHYSAQVTIAGANDIETWGSAQASDVMQWEAGYAQGTSLPYYDYGSASGCPEYTHTGSVCDDNGNKSFSQNSYWYLSWGALPAQALPQIYNGGQKDEWVEIDEYAHLSLNDTIAFSGPLNEYYRDPSTYSPPNSWSAMVYGLAYYGNLNTNMRFQDSVVAT